jgi:hypothetical protein
VPKLDSNLQCPSCAQPLVPKLLGCDGCGIKVEGPFQINEFATLPPDDLHFLRIFVRCEGRVRDMESALGLSYPTIRARMTELKEKLGGSADGPEEPETEETAQILADLESKKIPFAEAMKRIRKTQKKK